MFIIIVFFIRFIFTTFGIVSCNRSVNTYTVVSNVKIINYLITFFFYHHFSYNFEIITITIHGVIICLNYNYYIIIKNYNLRTYSLKTL